MLTLLTDGPWTSTTDFGLIDRNCDPVAPHRVPSSQVPLQILDVPGRVDELEPLGDAGEHGPARTSPDQVRIHAPALSTRCRTSSETTCAWSIDRVPATIIAPDVKTSATPPAPDR